MDFLFIVAFSAVMGYLVNGNTLMVDLDSEFCLLSLFLPYLGLNCDQPDVYDRGGSLGKH